MEVILDVFDGLTDSRRIDGQQHSLHDKLVMARAQCFGGRDLHRHGPFWPGEVGVSVVISKAGKGGS